MSVQHIALVLEAADLCAQEKAVLTAFCNHTDPSGRTFAGEARLMRESGMPRTTFQRWRRELVKRNLLFSRRKGRPGGGRATSDTYVNLELLRSMRDPFFGENVSDRPEDENPFADVNYQVNSNGSTSGAKGQGNGSARGAEGGGNGSTGGAIKGSASGAGAAPPVEPITLRNPQSEPSSSSVLQRRRAAAREILGTEQEEEEIERNSGQYAEALEIITNLPQGSGISTTELAPYIAEALAIGWHPRDLRRELTRDHPRNVSSLTGLYIHRMKRLGTPGRPDHDTDTSTPPGRSVATVDRLDVELIDLRQDANNAASRITSGPDRQRLGAWIRGASKAQLAAFIAAPSSSVLESDETATPSRATQIHAAATTLADGLSIA